MKVDLYIRNVKILNFYEMRTVDHRGGPSAHFEQSRSGSRDACLRQSRCRSLTLDCRTAEQILRGRAAFRGPAQDDAGRRAKEKNDLTMPEEKGSDPNMSSRVTAQRFSRDPFCGGILIARLMTIEPDPVGGHWCLLPWLVCAWLGIVD